MKDQDLEKALITLNSIVGCELAGVVKYTHFALMVTGPDRLVLDKFFLQNKKIDATKIRKYYYTIKTKSEFKRYGKNNNLIFENL